MLYPSSVTIGVGKEFEPAEESQNVIRFHRMLFIIKVGCRQGTDKFHAARVL